MDNQIILARLNQIEKLIVQSTKEIFTLEDLINYTGFTRSYIYKLVANKVLPYSKPTGKFLFFAKKDVDQWLMKELTQSTTQIELKAVKYINDSRKK